MGDKLGDGVYKIEVVITALAVPLQASIFMQWIDDEAKERFIGKEVKHVKNKTSPGYLVSSYV